jgi:hypothetical protein
MWPARKRRRKCSACWWESPRQGGHLEERGIDGKMGSECNYIRKIGWEDGEDPVGSGHGPMADSCKYGDETSVSGATE